MVRQPQRLHRPLRRAGDPGGGVLDPGGIAIQTGANNSLRPSVAHGGGAYLAVWDVNGDNIWGSRVTPAGAVVDPGGIPISLASDSQESPTVAFNGSFLVAWNDRRSGITYDIYSTTVATNGTVNDTAGQPLSTGAADELEPAVTRASSGWGVAYQHPLPGGSGIFHRGAK